MSPAQPGRPFPYVAGTAPGRQKRLEVVTGRRCAHDPGSILQRFQYAGLSDQDPGEQIAAAQNVHRGADHRAPGEKPQEVPFLGHERRDQSLEIFEGAPRVD